MSISLSGLSFYDNTLELPFNERLGATEQSFAPEYAEVDLPLPFEYIATDAISTFVAIKLDNLGNEIETLSLSTSLIVSNGLTHKCNGLTEYVEYLYPGTYKFKVNDRYESKVFNIMLNKQGIDYDIIECTQIVY